MIWNDVRRRTQCRSETVRPFPTDLPELTSIRAIAATMVILFHFYAMPDAVSAGGRLVAAGGLGVDLFFMLSGLILTHVYWRDWQNGRFAYDAFLVRRLARLYPVHLTTLLGFVALYTSARAIGVESSFEGENWSVFWVHVLGLHAWGLTDGAAWNHPSWSISAEIFAYLGFPLWLLAAARLGTRMFLLVTVLVFLAVGAALEVTGVELTGLTHNFGILRVAVEFGLGVGIYLFLLDRAPQPDAGRRTLMALASAVLATFAGLPEFLVVGLLGAMLAFLADAARQDGVTLLRVPALQYLGRISYSTYMVHIAFVIVGGVLIEKAGLSHAAEGMGVLVLVVAIHIAAALMHELVERPCQRAVLRILAPRSARPKIASQTEAA